MGMKYRATIPDFINLRRVFFAGAEALELVATSRFWDPQRSPVARNTSQRAGSISTTGGSSRGAVTPLSSFNQ